MSNWKYFSEDEFKCNHCGELPPQGIDTRLIDILDDVREIIGQPLLVTSGYRCEYWNEVNSGVRNSQHVEGTAADITYDGIDVERLAQVVENVMAAHGVCGGIGRYYDDLFVHVDVLESPPDRRW